MLYFWWDGLGGEESRCWDFSEFWIKEDDFRYLLFRLSYLSHSHRASGCVGVGVRTLYMYRKCCFLFQFIFFLTFYFCLSSCFFIVDHAISPFSSCLSNFSRRCFFLFFCIQSLTYIDICVCFIHAAYICIWWVKFAFFLLCVTWH